MNRARRANGVIGKGWQRSSGTRNLYSFLRGVDMESAPLPLPGHLQ